MSKLFPAGPFQVLITSVLLLGAASLAARADDRFSLAVGQHGDLLIFGPKGEKVADLPIPSISQPVTVNGTTSFQVSYGRDVNDKLTAILAPNATQPEDLHFNVLNKSVDTDKAAVVTLTFSRSLGSVTVDPGYVGLVQVNSEKIRHHDLADNDAYAPAPPPAYSPAPAPMDTSYTPAQAPAPRVTTDVAPRDVSPNPAGYDHQVAAANTDSTPTVSDVSTSSDTQKPLFWSEPVTGPTGTAPHVASNEMKLVEVQGGVSVVTPDGTSKDGSNGMIVPSGSVVSTSDGSSAAVFIGGVDSARLLPDSNVKVVQHLNGSVRHTTLDLQKGTVFSRVGRRSGETQQYEVRTPQGVAAARGTEFADTLHDGHHYVFVQKGTVDLFVDGHLFLTVQGHGGSSIGSGAMPPADNLKEILHEILLDLQPFNTKTNDAFFRINNHTATGAEVAYYEAALLGAAFISGEDLDPGLRPHSDDAYTLGQVGVGVTVALHDLLPFIIPSGTPH